MARPAAKPIVEAEITINPASGKQIRVVVGDKAGANCLAERDGVQHGLAFRSRTISGAVKTALAHFEVEVPAERGGEEG